MSSLRQQRTVEVRLFAPADFRASSQSFVIGGEQHHLEQGGGGVDHHVLGEWRARREKNLVDGEPYSQRWLEERNKNNAIARKYLGVKGCDGESDSGGKAKPTFKVFSHAVLLALHNARRQPHGRGPQGQKTDQQYETMKDALEWKAANIASDQGPDMTCAG